MSHGEKALSMFDQMLKFAAEQRLEEMADESVPDEELGAYPSDLDNRMDGYFKKVKRRSFYRHAGKVLMRAAIVLIAVIAVSTTLVLTVDAFRIPALEFFSKAEDNALSVIVKDGSGIYDSYSESLSGLYLPEYIPEGYAVDTVERIGSMYSACYKNATGDYIIFQNLIEGSVAQIDNEDAAIEEVTVNGEVTQFYMKNHMSNLLFKYQKKVYLLSGYVGKDDAVRMANSLNYFK